MRHLLLFLTLGACAGGDTDPSGGPPDLGVPHFRLTVDGTPLDWPGYATAAGESDLNIGGLDQPSGDRDGFGFLVPAVVGTYDCDEVRATYSRIRDNSTNVTSWPTLGNAGAVCAVTLTDVSTTEGETVAGTFAFTIPGAAETLVITDGSFRLLYESPS